MSNRNAKYEKKKEKDVRFFVSVKQNIITALKWNFFFNLLPPGYVCVYK